MGISCSECHRVRHMGIPPCFLLLFFQLLSKCEKNFVTSKEM